MKKILLADDDAALRRLLARTIGEEKFQILYAADGQEAVTIAQRECPDLVLLDIIMPKLDGMEVCRLLRTNPATRGSKIVILTVKVSEADRLKALQMGADGYLTKPFSPIALLDRIYEILGEGVRRGETHPG